MSKEADRRHLDKSFPRVQEEGQYLTLGISGPNDLSIGSNPWTGTNEDSNQARAEMHLILKLPDDLAKR